MVNINSDRVNINGDYLLVAPKPEQGNGLCYAFSERAYLVDNLSAFLEQFQDVAPSQITIYELREINEK